MLKTWLGTETWKAFGALCASWMGGSVNMIAIQAALNISSKKIARVKSVEELSVMAKENG